MKALMIKIWALGEIVLTTEAVRNLRSNLKIEHLTYLTGKRGEQLLAHNPHLDEIITVDENIFLKPEPFQILKLIHKIRAKTCDLCLILHHDKNFINLSKFLGIETVMGIDRDGEGKRLDMSIPMNPQIHQAEEYTSVSLLSGGSVDDAGLEVHYSKNVPGFIEENIKDDEFILLAPSGGVNPKTHMLDKRMPKKILIPLIRYLMDIEYPVYTIGASIERETGEFIELISEGHIRSLMGKTNLNELSVLISKASLLITNDSLPVHLSSALKTPTVVVYGPTNPVRYGPYKNECSRVIYPSIECAPCYKDGYIRNCEEMKCWNSLSHYDIIEGIEELDIL